MERVGIWSGRMLTGNITIAPINLYPDAKKLATNNILPTIVTIIILVENPKYAIILYRFLMCPKLFLIARMVNNAILNRDGTAKIITTIMAASYELSTSGTMLFKRLGLIIDKINEDNHRRSVMKEGILDAKHITARMSSRRYLFFELVVTLMEGYLLLILVGS